MHRQNPPAAIINGHNPLDNDRRSSTAINGLIKVFEFRLNSRTAKDDPQS